MLKQTITEKFEKLFTAELLQKNPAASISELKSHLFSAIRETLEEVQKEIENKKLDLGDEIVQENTNSLGEGASYNQALSDIHILLDKYITELR